MPQIDKVAQPPFNWALAWTGGCHNVVDVANTFPNKNNSIPIYALPLNYELIEIKQFLLIKMSDFTFHCIAFNLPIQDSTSSHNNEGEGKGFFQSISIIEKFDCYFWTVALKPLPWSDKRLAVADNKLSNSDYRECFRLTVFWRLRFKRLSQLRVLLPSKNRFSVMSS